MNRIETPHYPGYHFMTDMTGHAIEWMKFEKSLTPDKPFFMYFAPGAVHAPHQSVAYGKRIKIYPLAQAASPPPSNFTDAFDTIFDSTIHYDATFYRHLDRVVQNEPWLQRDRAMIDQLKTIGIEKGRPFNPDKATLAILDGAAREAHALLAQRYEAGFPVINPGIRWFPAAMAEMVKATQSGYGDPMPTPSMSAASPIRSALPASSASASRSSI